MVNKNRKIALYVSVIILVFLVLSLITQNWNFLLWSLLPVFMVLMISFSSKMDKKNN
ncbi:uncharacterized protein (DUF58 family) [Lederbergia galactosidilyticus]|nr:uncharacterized protein (DUF58 family) [Lederbergia galactosidilytica]